MAGVYDLRPLVSTYVNEPLKLSCEDAKRNSPLLLVNDIANNLLSRVRYVSTAITKASSTLIKLERECNSMKLCSHSYRHLSRNCMSI